MLSFSLQELVGGRGSFLVSPLFLSICFCGENLHFLPFSSVCGSKVAREGGTQKFLLSTQRQEHMLGDLSRDKREAKRDFISLVLMGIHSGHPGKQKERKEVKMCWAPMNLTSLLGIPPLELGTLSIPQECLLGTMPSNVLVRLVIVNC